MLLSETWVKSAAIARQGQRIYGSIKLPVICFASGVSVRCNSLFHYAARSAEPTVLRSMRQNLALNGKSLQVHRLSVAGGPTAVAGAGR